jgi:fucose permease
MGEAEVQEKRSKQRWVITAFFFLSGVLTATWSSRIPEIQAKLGLNNAALGTVLFAIPVGLLAGLSVAGWLVTTVGAKRILLTGGIICAVLLFLSGVAGTSIQLMMVLFLLGMARTIYNLAANTSAVELQRVYKQSIISSFHGVWSLACFIAAGVSTAMIVNSVQPQIHFAFIAVLGIIMAVALLGGKSNYAVANEKRPLFVKPDKYLFLVGLLALCAMLCEGAMFDWSVNYFEKVVRAKKSMVTTGYMSFIVAMATGRLIGDRLISRYGMYRMLMINGFLMAAGFAIAVAFPFVFAAAFGFLLVGSGSSILVPIVYMLAARSKKMSSAYALASVTSVGYSGFLIGPLFIGNVSQYFGMQVAFVSLSFISLLIVVLSLKVKRMAED